MPLRQYSPERLDPIVVRHVPEGFREGGAGYARNKPEAEALVEAIVQCTKDPRYLCTKDDHHPNGKLTFGVISLQGEEQAKLINQLLLERLTPEEIEQRELVCGDAYAFQGDERDVMFLSMVASPNQRIGALTKTADMQRFNVSASRARDQVWLFHTVTLNELNPADMRYKLLAYYSNPAEQPAGKPDWEKCDSDFERDVGKIISAKNYRLIPQYEPFGPGSYRIDFVIEGLKSRLAVEVDGPHHDDPEQIASDMVRQRQLERCKWVFWRVSASSFYFDREKAMASLWRRLEELGIHPLEPAVTSESSPNAHHSKPALVEDQSQVNPSEEKLQKARTLLTKLREVYSTVSNKPIPSPPRQPDLIPSNQMELPKQKPDVQPSNAEATHDGSITQELQQYVLAAKQKRAHGVLVYDEIGYVVLELMPSQERVRRDELIKKTANVLEFEEVAFKRIDEAIRHLEKLKKVSTDSNYVWRCTS